MSKSPDAIVIATNHRMDKGGECPRALEERGIPFRVVDLTRGFPEPRKMGGIIALGSPYENSQQQIASRRY